MLRHLTEVPDEKRRVSLLSRPEVRLNAKMHAQCTALEPHAAAPGEVRRLRHFGQSERAAIELTSESLLPGRHGELNMVEAVNLECRGIHRGVG